jgi:alpha-tubulin suppressor-like RCC1 family protein
MCLILLSKIVRGLGRGKEKMKSRKLSIILLMPALMFGVANSMQFTLDAAAGDSIVAISAGSWHALALKSDGSLWAWGFNDYGQLGNGTSGWNNFRNTPVMTGTSTDWTAVSAGGYHTTALKSDRSLWAWGDNDFGQLGNDTTTDSSVPVRVGTDTNWTAISAGYYHTLALKSDGSLWAWGHNDYGQLGDNTIINRKTPVRVAGSSANWKAVSAGIYHTLALKTDGTLWAWGDNGYGQLGDGTDINRKIPVQVGTDNDWLAVSAGNVHSLALKSDGTLWAWGGNNYGQIGDNTTIAKNAPVRRGTDNKWKTISAGNAHSLALKSDGTLWTWGSNNYGQLGDGTRTNHTSPVQAGSDTSWTAISAGGYYTTALKSNGSPWAWGDNGYGQIGDGTNGRDNIRNSPVIVGSNTDWVAIPATVESVIVNPGAATVQKGTDYQFSATVTGTYNPDQGVTWNVSGNAKPGTDISANGILRVDADETAEILTVAAISTVDVNKYGTATVMVIEYTPPEPTVSSVTIYPPDITLEKGDSFKFNAIVAGTHNPDQSVTWSVSGNDEAGTAISEDGTLNIDENETSEELIVKATSTVDESKYGTAAVTVTQDDGSFEMLFVPVTSITDVPATTTAGTPLFLTGTVNPGNATNQDIVWIIKDAGHTGAEITGNMLYATAPGTVTVTATIENGFAIDTDYTEDFGILVHSETGTIPEEPGLIGIAGLSFEMDENEPVFIETEYLEFEITDDGEGNFSATIYGDTDTLTIYGVEYIIANIPAGVMPELVIERDGIEILWEILDEREESGLYISLTEMSFDHGAETVFKLYVDDTLVGTFTVTYVYVNETHVTDVLVRQSFAVGSYYFAPVELLGRGYNYEITNRPQTFGGTAPSVNTKGQFIFDQQVLPVTISRAGEYIVEVTDNNDNLVAVYRIIVE